MGGENLTSGGSHHHRRYGSQAISVPFLWEQKPGLPKTGGGDWPPKPSPPSIQAAGIISVPFLWEERPGKPLPPDLFILDRSDQEGDPRNEAGGEECAGIGRHLAKRTLTLGELILLSRRLSCPNNVGSVGNTSFLSMDFMRSLSACFPIRSNDPKISHTAGYELKK